MIDPLPGDIFRQGQILNNTYEIEGVLGRGGTGEVYRARNQISGRIVAIKALNRQFSGNDAYLDLMKREEQMRDILDDAVVRYTECSRSDQGHVFLVMDFIDGPSISDVMARRRMEPRELLIVAHRVAEGLVAAHGKGIVHRDLSPDNIILRGGSPERATIIDFGIAKDTAAGARTVVGNDFAGKYEYAAPEQLEGRAETRSDLYALGALLLAAFRGQVPFAGATPGEMVRRKQSPLETEGVPEPLKGLIDWLAAPKLQDRAPSARAVVARLDAALKPGGQRERRGPENPSEPRRRGGLGWIAAVLVLAAVLGGAWYGDVVERLFPTALPVASPWRLTAEAAGAGPARFSGHAPDAGTAARLAEAYGAATGRMPEDGALSVAAGMPFAEWPAAVTTALDAIRGLEDWRLDLSDRAAAISALAPDKAARTAAEAALGDWAARYGIELSLDLATGPRTLSPEAVGAMLDRLADCGPLHQDDAGTGGYPLGATVTVRGDVAAATTADAIRAALEASIGDRRLLVETTVLNDDLCAVRRVLPAVPSNGMAIWLGDGDTGQPNLSGVYTVGDNPIVEVQAPASLAGGSIWVVVVDNTGKVFNVLPNLNFEEHALDAVGVVQNGVRRIRVLHTIADFAGDNRLLAYRVSDTDFGKSEVIAILSRESLFETRPREESVGSFTEALEKALAERPGNVIAVATRLLDSRP